MPPAKRTPARKSTSASTSPSAVPPAPEVAKVAKAAARRSAPAGAVKKAAGRPRKAASAVTATPAGAAEPARGAATPRKARKAPVKRSGARKSAAPTPRESTAGAEEVAVAAGAGAVGGSGSGSGSGSGTRDRLVASVPVGGKSPAFGDADDPEAVRETGRTRRQSLRRQDLGSWTPPAGRPDPIDLIAATNEGRIPSLIPLRWTRMLESPLAFLRGAAVVMAFDLAGSPTSGLTAQICGDAHLANFGLFASRERRQVLDVNDFDESLTGPWEFDLKRLAASIVLSGRNAGRKEKACVSSVAGAVAVYRETVHALAGLPVLSAWSASPEELGHLVGIKIPGALRPPAGKARFNATKRVVKQMASRDSDGDWRFSNDPPLLTRLPEKEAATILAGLEDYAATLPDPQQVLLRRFRPVDVALRVGGLGSIGLRTYVVLLAGNGPEDPLVLQVKESRTPTIGQWVGRPDTAAHQGHRVVAAEQIMQTASDPLLGWTRIEGRDYLVRQFRTNKTTVDATRLKKNQVDDYGRLFGALLARAHCRSLDARLLAGYLGNGAQVDSAMIDFAVSYAGQTERDHGALVQAAVEGRVPTV
jgi:uncharacterized protein (DUF2252 family)